MVPSARKPPHPVDSTDLAVLERGEQALAQVQTVEEAVNLRDRADDLRSWLKRRKRRLADVNAASLLRFKAERKLGEMLGARSHDETSWSHDETSSRRTLADLGISKNDSHRWQKLAAIPDGIFKAFCDRALAEEREITAAALYRLADQHVEPDAEPAPTDIETACTRLIRACQRLTADWPEGDEARDALVLVLRNMANEVEQTGSIRLGYSVRRRDENQGDGDE